MNNTNFIGLWQDLELESHNVLFWMMFHQQRYTIDDIRSRPDFDSFDKIILLDQEVNQLQFDDSKIHLILPSVSTHPNKHSFLWWNWFVQSNESIANHLRYLTANDQKNPTYKFDALLGTLHYHKKLMFDYIQNDKNFCMPVRHSTSTNSGSMPGFPGDVVMENFTINGYEFHPGSRSSIIPYLIYNDSWYTLACETTYAEDPMFSEKTAKPMLAKRIFVLIGNQHHIKGLKSFGFKTFDRIIDESFDNYEQVEDRCKGAWDQIQWMLEQDPLELYEKVEDILEHNQQLILNTDYVQQLKTIVHNIINT